MDRALKRDVRLAWGTVRPKGSRCSATRSRSDSAASRTTSSCSRARSRGSTCSRAASSIPATRSSSIAPGTWARCTRSTPRAPLVGWDIVRHDLDELEDLILRFRPKLIYTNPTFQNPTGWTMPSKLRRQLLSLATRLRVPIIEDDTYRELHLGTPPPRRFTPSTRNRWSSTSIRSRKCSPPACAWAGCPPRRRSSSSWRSSSSGPIRTWRT